MNTERLLQTCVALMTALATLMLGTSLESSWLPVMAFVAAGTSLVFTDILRWLQIHRYFAGFLGLIAVLYTFMETRSASVDIQFISVAKLLILLQIILLFQKKTMRIYWQLIVLSLLQVVVAAALNLFFLFGALLVFYAALAIAALLLLFIVRETSSYVDLDQRNAASREIDGSAVIEIDGIHERSRVRIGGCSVVNPRRDLLRRSLLRHLGLISVNTAVVSAAVFCLMPRFGNGVWRATSTRQTGYSGELDLDDDSSILESPAIVMRVSFVDQWSGKPYTLGSEPYLRGSVLSLYQPKAGRWTKRKRELQELKRPNRLLGVVRQNVSLEKQGGNVVFGVAPLCRLDNTSSGMQVDPATLEIIQGPADGEDPAQYSIGSTAFRGGISSEFLPVLVPNPYDSSVDAALVREKLPLLSETAEQILIEANIPLEDRLARARALKSHFSSSGLYRYSLDPSPDRNRDIDPVEDFVSNHRTGHCQYFASALALMLRSQGIPARIVVGYRGGTFNAVGSYYQIRELDAHAWVEALLLPEHVPNDEILPTEGLTGAAWVRLDPTPDDSGLSQIMAISKWRAQLNDAMDYMQLLWSEYVLGLNQKRQRKAIYEPLQEAFRRCSDYCFGREQWAARWQLLRPRFRGELFTRQTAMDAGMLILVLATSFFVFRFLVRLAGGIFRRILTLRRSAHGPTIEFYRRLESLLARHGLRRRPNQTPLEFADVAAHHLRGPLAIPAVAAIPAAVVDLFYRVRFGQDHLDTEDTKRLESLLQQLQQALAGDRKR